jgi:hypothetical protein
MGGLFISVIRERFTISQIALSSRERKGCVVILEVKI